MEIFSHDDDDDDGVGGGGCRKMQAAAAPLNAQSLLFIFVTELRDMRLKGVNQKKQDDRKEAQLRQMESRAQKQFEKDQAMLREAANPAPPAAPQHGHWVLEKGSGYYYNQQVKPSYTCGILFYCVNI